MPSSSAPHHEIIRVKLADLQPHPSQPKHFRPRPRHEIEELARDMQRRGLQNPIQVLPDGTIIAGHQRVEAARLLGWDEIDARVRQDLADDPARAEEALVADNLFGRQMGPLDIARAYKGLKELARGQGSLKGDLRDQIGLRLNMSGRNLDRYLRVLEQAPQEVQDAVSANNLPFTLAEKVTRLSKPAQERIAQEIGQGDIPRDVVARHLRRPAAQPRRVMDMVNDLLRSVQRGLKNLGEHVGTIRLSPEERPLLQEAEDLFRQLREQVMGDGERDEEMLKLLEELDAEEEESPEEVSA